MGSPIVVASTDTVYCIGDSITNGFTDSNQSWVTAPSPFVVNLVAPFRPGVPTHTGYFSGSASTTLGAYPLTGRAAPAIARNLTKQWPSFGWAGQAGRKVGDISATVGSLIPHDTTVLLVELGINDATATVAAATFATQVRQLRDGAFAACPNLRALGWVGPFCSGENWPNGANASDTITDGITDKCNQLITIMAEQSNTFYIDTRTAWGAAEAVNNPSHLTSGILTGDGLHFSSSLALGKQVYATAILAKLQ